MDVHLDPKESELLRVILERRIEDLRHEIHHTDNRTFRAALKADETVLEALLQKVKAPALMGI